LRPEIVRPDGVCNRRAGEVVRRPFRGRSHLALARHLAGCCQRPCPWTASLRQPASARASTGGYSSAGSAPPTSQIRPSHHRTSPDQGPHVTAGRFQPAALLGRL